MWLIFAILAPVCWALANPLDAALRRNFIKNDYALTWAFALTRLPLAIILIIIFNEGFIFGWHVVGMFIAGLLWMVPFIFYYKALEFEETGRVILILQFLPVFTFLIAAILIRERLDLHQFVAFVVIFSGSILAAVKRGQGKWHFSKAFLLIVLAAFGWAVADVLFKKFAVEFPNFWQAFAIDILGSSFPAIFFLKMLRAGRYFKVIDKKGWKFFIISAFVATAGSLSFAYALTLGKASLVAVISGLQPLLAILFAFTFALFFREIPKESLKPCDLILKIVSFILMILGLVYLNY